MTRGFCDRCQPFNQCLGLLELSDDEWKSVKNLIDETYDLLNVKKAIESKELKICSGS